MSRPDYKPTPPDDPRRVAYDVLRAVSERDAYANLTLPGLLRERRLDGRDAALATELSYGSLRAQGSLDAILQACVDRPLGTVDAPVLDVLRLGAYQLLRTRVPTHAAVSATVDLARTVLTHGQVGFVNAVLRKVSVGDETHWLDIVAPSYDVDPVGHLGQKYAHPGWIVRAYHDALGGDWEQTAAALAADDARPQVHLVARPGRITREHLMVDSGGAPGPWSPYAVRLDGGDPGGLAAVRDGRAAVQDEGSQMCAIAVATADLAGSDERWLDLCAGPGGKGALLGCLAAERGPLAAERGAAAVDRGVRVLAVELQAHRARLVSRAVRGLPVLTVLADGRRPPGHGFDRVLVDAPCTGLGALRRRPEARWRRQPSDIPALSKLQRELLTAGLAAARPGGLVGYVTCSPHLAETRAVVAEVARRTGAEQLDARPALSGVPHLGPGPHVQLWPHRHGTDAMFLALLRAG